MAAAVQVAGVAASRAGSGAAGAAGEAVPGRAAARACARCGQDDRHYLDLGRKLLFFRCGHFLCQDCKKELSIHREFKCPAPGCMERLRRSDTGIDTPEEAAFKLEVQVRKQYADVLRTPALVFGDSATEYNDFIEEVEHNISKLVCGTKREKDEAERLLQYYKAKYASSVSSSGGMVRQPSAAVSPWPAPGLAGHDVGGPRGGSELTEAQRRRARKAVDVLLHRLKDSDPPEREDLEKLKATLQALQKRIADRDAAADLAQASGMASGAYYGGTRARLEELLPQATRPRALSARRPPRRPTQDEAVRRLRAGGFSADLQPARAWEREELEDMLLEA